MPLIRHALLCMFSVIGCDILVSPLVFSEARYYNLEALWKWIFFWRHDDR